MFSAVLRLGKILAKRKRLKVFCMSTKERRSGRIGPRSPEPTCFLGTTGGSDMHANEPPRKRPRSSDHIPGRSTTLTIGQNSCLVELDRWLLVLTSEYLSTYDISHLRLGCPYLHNCLIGHPLDLSKANLSLKNWLSMFKVAQNYRVLSASRELLSFGEAWSIEGLRVDFPLQTSSLRAFLDDLNISRTLRILNFSVLLSGNIENLVCGEDLSSLEELVYYVDEDYSHCLQSAFTGDLKALSVCQKLRVIELSFTKVYGDIGPLAALTQLVSLELDGSEIYGALHTLSSVNTLTTLRLGNTNVTGDISALSELTTVKTLDLFGSRAVNGNILSLSALTGLKMLDLFGTGVTGNISGILTLTALTSLNLEYCQIEGDQDDFRSLIPGLQVA